MRWVDENDKSKGLEWNTFVDNVKNVYTADEEHPYKNIRIVGEGTIDGNGWPEISKMKQAGDATEEKYISPQYVAGACKSKKHFIQFKFELNQTALRKMI